VISFKRRGFPLPMIELDQTIISLEKTGRTFGNSQMTLSLLMGGGNGIFPFLLSCMITWGRECVTWVSLI